MKTITGSISTLLLVSIASTQAIAAAGLPTEVRLVLEGTVTTIAARNSVGGDDTAAFREIVPFTVGTPMTAVVTYDPAAIDTNTVQQNLGRYFTGTNTISIGDTVFQSDSLLDVLDGRAFSGLRRDVLVSRGTQVPHYNADGWTWTNGGIATINNNRITLIDTSQTVFDSDTPPTGDFSEANFDSLEWVISDFAQAAPNTLVTPLGTHVGEYREISGTFSNLTVIVIPEPSTIFLSLGFAGGILAWRRR